MKKKPQFFETRLGILLWHYAAMLLVFIVEKPLFMAYACPSGPNYQAGDSFRVACHGFGIDLSVASYLVAFPLLAALASVVFDRFPMKKVVLAYDILLSFVLSAIFIGDAVLYPFWGYKLDASVFMYLSTPKEALASVSPWMSLLGIALILLVAWLVFRLLTMVLKPVGRLLPRENRKWTASAFYLFLMVPLFLAIRGGFKESTMNVGHAYFSQDQFLNHSAVNPAFSLISSMSKSDDYSLRYDYFPEDKRSSLADSLFVVKDSGTVELLKTSRPNVLLLILEGFGADFTGRLGGMPEVTPNLDRMIDGGVSFTGCYAGSFRTDRGLVCVVNGHPGLPGVSIMKMPVKSAALPSVAATLAGAGYSTRFIYGGDINFTNMKSWLYGAGYQEVVSDVDFPAHERHGNAWGVNDGVSFPRVLEEIEKREEEGTPWFMTFLSLSSHEPFEVPYDRFPEMKPNSFAYADSCLGAFADSLRNSPAWNNLLLVVTADHGFRYPDGEGHAQAPHVHHIPFLLTGGAVSHEPCSFSMLMNQSDIAATVLSQLGLDHGEFSFSRNVLSSAYSSPFAFYTFNNGFCVIDDDGYSLFDADADKCVDGESLNTRTDIGKAILQTLFDDLEKR